MKTLISILWSVGELALLLAAGLTGHEGLGNLVTILVWWNLVGGLLLVHNSEKLQQVPEKRPRWLLHTLDTSDFILVGIAGYFGWWWTVAALFIDFVGSVSHRHRHDKEEGEAEPSA